MRILVVLIATGVAVPPSTLLAQARPPAKPAAPLVNPNLPKPAQVAQLQARASELQQQDKWTEAAAALQQAAELLPEDATLWDQAGWGHLDAGQAAPALAAFERARKLTPAGRAPGGMLIAQFALGNEKAVLELARELAPPETAAQAEAAVKKGLAAGARSVPWDFALGFLYARVLGSSGRGLGPLEAVVQRDPKNAEAWLLLTELNQELNRGPEEDAAAVQYLELAPETADAFRLRAQRYADLEKYAEATGEFEAGIQKHPEAAALYLGLARVHERAGEHAKAESTLTRLLKVADEKKLESARSQARMQLAAYYFRQGNYPGAERYYGEIARQSGASPSALGAWATSLVLLERWSDAAAAMEKAAARDEELRGRVNSGVRDELLAARYRAAVCRLAAGQKEPAQAALEGALALRGSSRTGPEMEAAAFLAWLGGGADTLGYRRSDERWAGFTWRRTQPGGGEGEARSNNSSSAVAWRAILAQVRKANPGCWPADYVLARIYATSGQTQEALALLDRVTQAKTDWWAPYYALGQYYSRELERDRAIAVLTKAVELAPEARQPRVMLTLLKNIRPDEEKK